MSCMVFFSLFVYMYICVRAFVYVYVYNTYACMFAYMCIYIYIHFFMLCSSIGSLKKLSLKRAHCRRWGLLHICVYPCIYYLLLLIATDILFLSPIITSYNFSSLISKDTSVCRGGYGRYSLKLNIFACYVTCSILCLW